MFVVRDSLGLITQPVVLRRDDIQFLQLFDGTKTVQDIQLFFMRQQGGLFVSSESIQSRLDLYDSLFLLDSDLYRQAKNKIFESFSRQDVRPASLAGRGYPQTADRLKATLDSFFKMDGQRDLNVEFGPLKALIAPHIDLEIGKNIYTAAYRALRGLSPKKIFLFGTGHSLQNSFISLTEKDYETPLGVAKTDKDIVRKLKNASIPVSAPDDFAHRKEHSIEFQVLFLQYLFGKTFEIVPILFGSFHDVLSSYSRPTQIPDLNVFLEKLRTILSMLSSDAICVAGVDFSHIGPKFGHTESSDSLIQKARAHDKGLIESICSGDTKEFWEKTQRVNGYYNVCGFSAISCLLEVLPKVKGRLLGYDFWEEEPTQSAVSYAAIGLA
ncbi:MAG: AmmeMemoRadiSam system protein B [Candidatus Aminicenantes bacterium]|nr:AmmeMemoRadiSam system protein B [Candidatus Aminicenantes bacterium]